MSTIVLVLPVAQVTVSQGRAVATATVTNNGSVAQSIVLGVFPPATGGASGASAVAWTSVDRPQRDLQPGATEQFTVTFTPPEGTASGTYAARFIAYSAYGAPEESADQARRLEVVVPSVAPPAPTPGTPWWVWVVAAALVLVVGTVAFLVLRPSGPCPDGSCASPSPSPTPTPTVVVEGITWTLTSIREGDAITVPASKKASLRVEGSTVSGSSGCNSYKGTWKRDGETVTVSDIATTLVLCLPKEVAQQGAKFLSILRSATRVTTDGDTMQLVTDDDRALRFQRA